MLWIIEPGRNALSVEYVADRDRMQAGPFKDQVTRVETSFSAQHASTALGGAVVPPGEPIFVLAHAGHDPHLGYWAAGVNLAGFAAMLVAKFGAQLNNRQVFLLVCSIGGQAATIAGHLSQHVTNMELYVPNGLMYISQAGIPHVVRVGAYASVAETNAAIAREDSDFLALAANSHVSGDGWTGVLIPGQPAAVVPIAAPTARGTITGTFDPDHDEH